MAIIANIPNNQQVKANLKDQLNKVGQDVTSKAGRKRLNRVRQLIDLLDCQVRIQLEHDAPMHDDANPGSFRAEDMAQLTDIKEQIAQGAGLYEACAGRLESIFVGLIDVAKLPDEYLDAWHAAYFDPDEREPVSGAALTLLDEGDLFAEGEAYQRQYLRFNIDDGKLVVMKFELQTQAWCIDPAFDATQLEQRWFWNHHSKVWSRFHCHIDERQPRNCYISEINERGKQTQWCFDEDEDHFVQNEALDPNNVQWPTLPSNERPVNVPFCEYQDDGLEPGHDIAQTQQAVGACNDYLDQHLSGYQEARQSIQQMMAYTRRALIASSLSVRGKAWLSEQRDFIDTYQPVLADFNEACASRYADLLRRKQRYVNFHAPRDPARAYEQSNLYLAMQGALIKLRRTLDSLAAMLASIEQLTAKFEAKLALPVQFYSPDTVRSDEDPKPTDHGVRVTFGDEGDVEQDWVKTNQDHWLDLIEIEPDADDEEKAERRHLSFRNPSAPGEGQFEFHNNNTVLFPRGASLQSIIYGFTVGLENAGDRYPMYLFLSPSSDEGAALAKAVYHVAYQYIELNELTDAMRGQTDYDALLSEYSHDDDPNELKNQLEEQIEALREQEEREMTDDEYHDAVRRLVRDSDKMKKRINGHIIAAGYERPEFTEEDRDAISEAVEAVRAQNQDNLLTTFHSGGALENAQNHLSSLKAAFDAAHPEDDDTAEDDELASLSAAEDEESGSEESQFFSLDDDALHSSESSAKRDPVPPGGLRLFRAPGAAGSEERILHARSSIEDGTSSSDDEDEDDDENRHVVTSTHSAP